MIVIVEYFNHFKLKSLRKITLVFLIVEIAGTILQHFNQAEMNVPKLVIMVNGVVWTLIMIVWIIFLFRNSAANFPALTPIRKYAISVMSVILINGTLPLIIGRFIDIHKYIGIFVVVISVLPYVFFIEFGLKLPMKNRAATCMDWRQS